MFVLCPLSIYLYMFFEMYFSFNKIQLDFEKEVVIIQYDLTQTPRVAHNSRDFTMVHKVTVVQNTNDFRAENKHNGKVNYFYASPNVYGRGQNSGYFATDPEVAAAEEAVSTAVERVADNEHLLFIYVFLFFLLVFNFFYKGIYQGQMFTENV